MSAIDKIEEIRKQNNTLWMDILRIAVESAPEKTKEILKKIDVNDRVISHHLRQVADEC